MKRALVSVSDKTGLVEFVKGLQTAIGISEVTGFPEICDGRVKTLHPKVHGALLARRDEPSHMQALQENGIGLIDLVCVNLYPFRQTIAKEGTTMAEAIEKIDIGGPSMLRSAAKNWNDVTVVCDPNDYNRVLAEIQAEGNTRRETRLQLSAKAYTHTAEYDMCIATYMRKAAGLNEKLFLEYDLKQGLRYGENPHQDAKFYAAMEAVPYSLASARQIHGKELSYNNIQDANAALNIVREFAGTPFCVGLKHMNPCGAAIGKDGVEAWTKAYEADKLMHPIFLEIIMAPSFTQEALDVLTTKKNLRLLEVDMSSANTKQMQYVSVNGGLLAQQLDTETLTLKPEMCVTDTKPTDSQMTDLQFAWRIVKHVKSNAIVVVKNGRTYGVGAGQMNRVGSAGIALKQAEESLRAEGLDIRQAGLVMGSDGFFPFADSVETAAEYGIKAIVQPGGSVRDAESIEAANAHHIAMLFTGMRHFKH